MIGVDRAVCEGLRLGLDFGAADTFGSRTDLRATNGQRVALDRPPVARALWLAEARASYALTERLRFSALANYTLNNPNGTRTDGLLTPVRRREGRWLSVGAGVAFRLSGGGRG